MRFLAIALFLLATGVAGAQDGGIEYAPCPSTFNHDPSIESLRYSQSVNGDCNGYTKLDAIVDHHLGVVYDMATSDLSIGQAFVEPDAQDVSETMTPCPHITPRGKVTEWFVLKGESCKGRPETGYRLYSADGLSTCIMPAVWCVPIEKLWPLGQTRARAAIERGKRLRKLMLVQ